MPVTNKKEATPKKVTKEVLIAKAVAVGEAKRKSYKTPKYSSIQLCNLIESGKTMKEAKKILGI